MSVITMLTTPEECVQVLSDLVENNAERLGIQYVGKNDERLLPRYPAVVVSGGQKTKEVHATHTFNVELRTIIWVYHAKVTQTHKERSMEDMALATALESLIEDDKTLGGTVVFSYVESSVPGVMAPRAGRGDLVVGTKMNWYALSQKRWD